MSILAGYRKVANLPTGLSYSKDDGLQISNSKDISLKINPSSLLQNQELIASNAINSEMIQNLDSSKITTGSINADRIPSLPSSKISDGVGIKKASQMTSAFWDVRPKFEKGLLIDGGAQVVFEGANTYLENGKLGLGTGTTGGVPTVLSTDSLKINNVTTWDNSNKKLKSEIIPNLDASKITTGNLVLPETNTIKIGSVIELGKTNGLCYLHSDGGYTRLGDGYISVEIPRGKVLSLLDQGGLSLNGISTWNMSNNQFKPEVIPSVSVSANEALIEPIYDKINLKDKYGVEYQLDDSNGTATIISKNVSEDYFKPEKILNKKTNRIYNVVEKTE